MRREVLSLVNVAVAAAALVVWFRYPQYAMYAVYALLGWFFVSFSLIWLLGAGPSGAPASASGAAGGRSPGLGRPSAGGVPAPFRAGFCVFCAADLPADATRCPACGHAVTLFG